MASQVVVLKEVTCLVAKAKGHMKVAEKGHWMLVVAMLIVHQIGTTKVCTRVHQIRGVQVMQCCHQSLRGKVVDLVGSAILVAS